MGLGILLSANLGTLIGYIFIPPQMKRCQSIVELRKFMDSIGALLVYPYEEQDHYILEFSKSSL